MFFPGSSTWLLHSLTGKEMKERNERKRQGLEEATYLERPSLVVALGLSDSLTSLAALAVFVDDALHGAT